MVTVLWWVLIAGGAALEVAGRIRPALVAPLSRLGDRVASHLPLRVALWVGWIFVGVHVFARYTLPGR
jgi:hypothetical protein